jgi:hypothetical protein
VLPGADDWSGLEALLSTLLADTAAAPADAVGG